jgi:hypothetical protein
MFSQSLDGLRAAIFFVDANGRIVHANAAVHFLVNEADVLRVAAGKLVAGESESDAALQHTFLVAATSDAAIGGTGIALPLIGKKGERHVAHVLPLTSGARQRARPSHTASAAVFVHKSAVEAPSPTGSYRHGLQADDGGAPRPACHRRCWRRAGSRRGARHRRNDREDSPWQYLCKTGTNRQADLVKLVAGFANPLMK